MDEKDILGKRFMDMSDANQWAQDVMGLNRTGFYNGKTDEWTKMVDKVQEHVNESGWSDRYVEFKTIWEFTKQNPGKDLGKIIFNASLEQGVKSIKKTQSGSEIKYRAYPEAWLEMWFRDYDAKLSMEVYNKAKAKEALNQINNKNK